MKNIGQWQKDFAKFAKKKFPKNRKWSQQDRILSILRQLADVSGGIQKEKGIFPHPNKIYDDPNHRIAALIADVLILCEMRKLNVEKELRAVLNWYKNKEGKLSK